LKKPDDGTLVPKPVAYTTFNFLTFILIKNLLAVRRILLIQSTIQANGDDKHKNSHIISFGYGKRAAQWVSDYPNAGRHVDGSFVTNYNSPASRT
jgi:hypothetical protein